MRFLLPLLFYTLLFSAPSGVYVEVNFDNPSSSDIAVEDSEYSYDKGTSGTVAVGYQMDQWRFELESNYSQNALSAFEDKVSELGSGDVLKKGGLVNVYYSAYNDTKLVSTIGLGVGATEVQTVDSTTDVTSDPSLTYQGSVSLGYMVDEDWTWTIKYRYLDIKDIESENQTYSLGLRYLF